MKTPYKTNTIVIIATATIILITVNVDCRFCDLIYRPASSLSNLIGAVLLQ